ncbi:MAG: glycosyltransferase family 4 protein [Lachnospiraceae bacterium]|nr:glycosyltransferase family 4 protein [Lachnospiraceae bacterium]
MSRVFIQVKCKYPHGEALANYIQNLAKAVLCAGYEVIIATDINEEYDFSTIERLNIPITVIPVVPSEDEAVYQTQKATGFCEERLGLLREYEITSEDRVLVFWLKSEYFLNELFRFEKQAGFKTICGMLELFDKEDYPTIEKYKEAVHIEGNVYLNADAILSISEYIDHYYMGRGMATYRFPPMIDSKEHSLKPKTTEKYKFIIPSAKDSLQFMLKAFAGLEEAEIDRIELHLCGISKEAIKGYLTTSEYERMSGVIILHDWMRYDALLALYQQMNFMVIARNICQRTLANFPSKVPEGMIYGVVPVVSDVGDYTKYYLKNGYDSLFIDGDSVQEIKKAVRRAISLDAEDYLRYSDNARKTAEERFDYRVWVPQVEKMLKDV